MASIFLSYASPDTIFALRLASHIKLLGHSVWIDQWEIGIGDYIPSKIGEGMDRADYVVVVLSKNTVLSPWVERELQIKYYDEITHKITAILPVIIQDCTIPPFLRSRRFADFRGGYEVGFAQLAITLHTTNSISELVFDYPAVTPCRKVTLAENRIYLDYNDSHMFGKTPKLVDIDVEIGIPYIGKITGTWKPDTEEQYAAWELYIELVTRVSVADLRADEGLLREGLSSLYIIFNTTRDILRKYGPSIGRPKNGSDVSFGYLAINVLNYVLRPVLAKWHPQLLDYEHARDTTISAFEHEKRWDKAPELRQELNDTRLILATYTNLLAQVADVPPLVTG